MPERQAAPAVEPAPAVAADDGLAPPPPRPEAPPADLLRPSDAGEPRVGQTAAEAESRGDPGPLDPGAYDDFTVPGDLPVDQEGMAEFRRVAADLGLSQSQAQSLVDLQAGRLQAAAAEQAAAWEKQQADWQTAVRSDRELGGNDMGARVGVARKAIARFGTPALRRVLTETGLGNHPELVRFAYRVGRSIADDGVILPSHPGRRKTAAETLYGSSDN